jgi:transcriptional regulator with GAF, ATPase, and Fis domain
VQTAADDTRSALEFERLLSELSATFIGLPLDSLDGHILRGLERVAGFLGADRAHVVEHDPARRIITRTHRWTREGVAAAPVSQSQDEFAWVVARTVGAREVVAVGSLDDLPPGAARDRAAFERMGLTSGAAVPMVVDGRAVGFLTFAKVGRETRWPPQLVGRLRLLGEIIGSALARQESERSLHTALEENERLRQQLAAENEYLQEEVRDAGDFGEIVGQSAGLRAALALVDQVAGTDAPVLLLGETGTGKELLARAIHQRSGRRDRPLVAINCAALPPTLIESELFGHEKGAFTGATQARPGRFELADGGTLFLDEIGDLDPALQTKLLRALQEGEIQRLGSGVTRKVDARVVAATNRDLARAMEEGRFRSDLYYRLGVFPIRVPPLRERAEDVPLLVWYLVRSRQRRLGRDIKSISRRAMEALQAYGWPGNVRELQNVVERALILSPGPTLRVDEALGLAARALNGAAPAPRGLSLRDNERAHVLRVLEACRWKIEGRGHAAERLGVHPSTLRNRMKILGIERPSP